MLFLIDYENVGNAGMRGCDCLNTQDHVIVFYSEAKKHMEQRALEAVASSGCTFEICKLCKTGKKRFGFLHCHQTGRIIWRGI